MPRTVSVAITANTSGFTAGMSRLSASAKSTATGIQAAFGKGFDSIVKNKRSIDTISSGLGKVGIAAGVGVGFAVKSFADFDKSMSAVAATGSDARANFDALRDAAIKAGADTKYSATEAAGGVEALAKAGVSAKDTLGGGLTGALNLAAAGNLDVAGSAEAAASAMNQFGLEGADIPHIADLLAQAAGTAQGEVSDMAAALNQSGLVANQFGLSVDETAQSLALFAKNGLVGSDAGTSFKTMLTSLYAPAGNAAKQLDQLQVSAYDASGAIKPIGVVTDELKAKLDQLSEGDRNKALKNIFGSDAIRAGTILLRDGSAGLQQMATDFGAFGSAADVAATKMDNLAGDLEQLKGSFETAFIGLGEGANGPLRSVVQGATDAVNAFNDLGSGTKSSILLITGGLAAVALGAAGLGKVAVFASEAKSAMTALGISAKSASVAVGAVGAVITVAALGFSAYAQNAAESRARVDDFTTALQSQNDAIQENVTKVAAKQLQDSGALTAARQLGLDLDTVTKAALGEADAMAVVNKATDDALAAINTPQEFDTNTQKSIAAAQTLQDAVGQTGSEYNRAVQDAKDFAAATGDASAAVQPDAYASAADALGKIGTEAGGAAGSVDELTSALFDSANAAVALSNSQIGYEQAVDDAAEAAKKLVKAHKDGAGALDVNTRAGRDNRTVLNNLAGASQRYIQDLADQGKGSKEIAAATRDARGEFIRVATAMTGSADKAKALADRYGLVPKKVSTEVEAKTDKAKTELATVKASIKGLPKKTQAEIIAAFKKGGVEAAKRALDNATKRREARIDAKAHGDAAVKRRLDEAARNRKSQIAVTDKGTSSANHDISEAARDRRTAIHVGDKGTGAASKDISEAARDRRANISVSTSGVGSANAAINDAARTRRASIIVDRHIVTRSATGGLITREGVVHRSNGGPVWGAGSATSDSIPAWLSNGEYVIRAAAVKAVGLSRLHEINSQGYARGGPVGFATGGPVGADAAAILAYMAAIVNPLKDVAKARADIAEARRDRQRANTHKERVKADRELTAATKDLKAAQKAVAETLKQTASTLADPYRSKSHDIDDWLESMKQGAADLKGFQDQIGQLRKLGVSEDIIKQITDQGAQVGSELAQQILDGGSELAKSLNDANKNLQKAADNLAYTATVKPPAPVKKADGGPISGAGTGTSDSILARVSNGEWIVPARAVVDNRSVLEAITYGRSVPDRRFTPAYAAGGYVQRPVVTKEIRQGDIVIKGNTIVDPDKLLRTARMRQRDAMTMTGLSRSL